MPNYKSNIIKMRSTLLILLSLIFSITAFAQTLSVDEKVDSLLQLMTLEEKIGQMTQAERGALETITDISYYSLGSLLSGGGSTPVPNSQAAWANMYDEYQNIALNSRLGIPLVYGVDAVHGHNNVYGAVIFPHNIGLGCTWNPNLVTTINQITAKEVAATGIDWTFSPCIAVPRNERWGRTYEGFGETAEVQKMMASASVIGLQGESLTSSETILACAKHFVGDGGTMNGIDQGNTVVSEEVLRELHMAGYIDAVEQNVGTVMASYNSWNGQKLHGHDYLLNDVLKEELGFEGFVISDWKGVDQVDEDYREAVKRSVNAGIDMVMVPDRYIYFISILKSLVADGEVSLERINDATRRILKQKFLLNLFEEPLTDPSLAADFGSQAHRDIARQAVRESSVLLNSKINVLPLQKNNQKILVAGKLANNLGAQCGGWSISWQGSNGQITEGTNILQGIQNLAETSEVIYSELGDYNESVDVAVVVVGENPYAEGAGDRNDLHLESDEISLIKRLKNKGIPVVTVLISGRPMIISDVLPYTDAFIAAWLPGSEGEGIAEILFGDHNPSGKLAHTWPRKMSQIPINFGDNKPGLFDYKHGLQQFSSLANSTHLSPYAAICPGDGQSVLLAISDKISILDYENEDFVIKIDGVAVPNIISDISIWEDDESILVIALNSELESSDEDLSISYIGSGIQSSTLELEPFEDFYICNDIGASPGSNDIPGKIQAENYYDMLGIQTEECTDIGGGINVGYIEPGDWMKYVVDVKQSGIYQLKSRMSGYNSGSLRFQFDEGIEASVNYTSTDGWQNWEDFSTEVYLNQGETIMTVLAQTDAFNINYYDFDLVDGILDNTSSIKDIQVLPNPVRSKFQVKLMSQSSKAIHINLYYMSGVLAQNLYHGMINTGGNTFDFIMNSDLPSGLYFVEIKDDEKRHFLKIIKE
ncbi:carbohydrate-binding protein [Lentimicrobium sp. S6]|nr:carbohydrate-binding protein [Lentimicrobium sp. S6]